jgi:hypothetical protein
MAARNRDYLPRIYAAITAVKNIDATGEKTFRSAKERPLHAPPLELIAKFSAHGDDGSAAIDSCQAHYMSEFDR